MISYLAPAGVDGAGCSYTAPCATLAAAVANTADNGQVVILATGVYGLATVTRPMTIRGEGGPVGIVGEVFVSGQPTNKVLIEDLNFEGTTSGTGGYAFGLHVFNGAEVVVRNSRFRGFLSAGIRLAPVGNTRVTFDNCSFVSNPIGIWAESAGAAKVKLFRSTFVGNSDAGVRLVGAGHDVLLSANRILGSAKALDLQGGATARSYGDNIITNGDTPAPAALN